MLIWMVAAVVEVASYSVAVCPFVATLVDRAAARPAFRDLEEDRPRVTARVVVAFPVRQHPVEAGLRHQAHGPRCQQRRTESRDRCNGRRGDAGRRSSGRRRRPDLEQDATSDHQGGHHEERVRHDGEDRAVGRDDVLHERATVEAEPRPYRLTGRIDGPRRGEHADATAVPVEHAHRAERFQLHRPSGRRPQGEGVLRRGEDVVDDDHRLQGGGEVPVLREVDGSDGDRDVRAVVVDERAVGGPCRPVGRHWQADPGLLSCCGPDEERCVGVVTVGDGDARRSPRSRGQRHRVAAVDHVGGAEPQAVGRAHRRSPLRRTGSGDGSRPQLQDQDQADEKGSHGLPHLEQQEPRTSEPPGRTVSCVRGGEGPHRR